MRKLPNNTMVIFSCTKLYHPPNLWCEMSWSEAQSIRTQSQSDSKRDFCWLLFGWICALHVEGRKASSMGGLLGFCRPWETWLNRSMLIRQQPLDRVRSKATDLARRLSECLCLWGALMSFSLVWNSSLIGTDKCYRTNPCDRGMCSILMHVLIFFDNFFKMINLNSPGGL